MAEEYQSRLQNAVDSMVKNLERENIRKMQGKMFRCSAECCDNEKASMQQVHGCIERCHAPLAQAQSLVTSELERFQVSGKRRSGRQRTRWLDIIKATTNMSIAELKEAVKDRNAWRTLIHGWSDATE
ncbi:protein FAM136A isoform X2 [Eleutherodactylus coqui]|uniref:protein FAM136A isoform X2 n=1 Tax=Eleutherodactylus coqui TaxID=57060 RepID=UPI003461FE48